MAKYIRRRIGFRRRNIRRFRRTFRRTGRFSMARAMKKDVPHKKETKVVQLNNTFNVPGNSYVFQAITPTSIVQGDGSATRDGQRIKFLAVRYEIEGMLAADVTDAPTAVVRFLLCSPKSTSQAAFETHLSNQNYNSYLDHQITSIYWDNSQIYQQWSGNLTQVYTMSGKGRFYKRGIIRFPRSVAFPPGVDTVEDPEDKIFLVVYNGNISGTAPIMQVRWRAKTTFVDV